MAVGMVYLGHHAKVRINNLNFRVISGQYEIMAEVHETTDSEAVVNANNVVGKENSAYGPSGNPALGEIQWSLEVILDYDSRGGGPTAALRASNGIAEGAVLTNLQIFPTGYGGNPITMPLASCERISGSFASAGGRPQVVRISGRSNGPYTHP